MSFLKHLLKNIILSFIFIYLTYLTWIDLEQFFLPVFVFTTVLLALAMTKYLLGKQNSMKIEQYRILLEYLSSRLSAGHTLESILLESFNRLKNELGYKSILAKSLRKLEQSMQAHLDLDRSLKLLKEKFNCPTSNAFFDVLPYLNHYGARLDIFVKQTYRTLNAEIQMQKDIESEQNAQKSEALILLFLPFLFSFVLLRQDTAYADSLSNVSWSLLLLGIIFCFAHLAICLVLWIMAKNPLVLNKKDIFINLPKRKPKSQLIQHIAQFLISNLPVKFGYNLSEAVRILSKNQPHAWLIYIRRKIIVTIITMIASILLALLNIISWKVILVPLLFVWFIQDLDIIQREGRLKQQIRIEYPNFLNSMVILLRSGLSLEKSLRLMISSYQGNLHSQLKYDLTKINHSLSVGESASYALIMITENLPQEEIASILQLMARYDRDGGQEILDILEIQSNASWQLYRNAIRKRLQSKNLILLFPMTIDLFLVIVMAMLPAIASLGTISL